MTSPEQAATRDLGALEDLVERALSEASLDGLTLLGNGEISCVLAWGGLACKRLPPFDSVAQVDAYRACFTEYIALLRQAGIEVLASSLEVLERRPGRYVVYCLQPILPAETLLPRRLRLASAAEAADLFERLLDHIEACGGGRLGLDAQVSNWALRDDGTPLYLDLTTPLYRQAGGREALDTELFVAALPRVAQGLVRRFMLQDILDTYYSTRRVVLDVLGNLYNERLDHLIPGWLEIANRRLADPIWQREVLACHRDDARTWSLVRRLFRLERFWVRRVRRGSYPVLLPLSFDRQ